ncbi:MAG TPA: hypothetical protein VGU23_10240 [Acidobacteriaceae bacterium]|nr:hypothetical protein [Acidobacteriaceae bacterium]
MISPEKLDRAARQIAQGAAFYQVDRMSATEREISFISTRSMPHLLVSTKGFQIRWDKRFFQFLRHIFMVMDESTEGIQLPTSSSRGDFHIESVIWCVLAERCLNRDCRDIPLALGIVLQSSVVLHHSMRVLGPFDDHKVARSGMPAIRLNTFEQFVREHEIAHFFIKAGEKPSDAMFEYFVLASRLIDLKVAEFQGRPDVHPTISEPYFAGAAARNSKPTMDEIWADLKGLDQLMEGLNATEIAKNLSPSLLLWIVSQGVLRGLAALRLLQLADALGQKSSDEFHRKWEKNREQFLARTIYMDTILHLMTGEDKASGEQRSRLMDLTFKIDCLVYETEADWKRRYTDGYLERLRTEGEETIERRSWDEATATWFCGDRLGWFRGKRPALPWQGDVRPFSGEELSTLSEKAHQIHVFRSKTSDGPVGTFLIQVDDDKENAFRAALNDVAALDPSKFGSVVAWNHGEEPSIEVLSFLKRELGIPYRFPREHQPEPSQTGTLIDAIRLVVNKAHRALFVSVLRTAVNLGSLPDGHNLKIDVDTALAGIEVRNTETGELSPRFDLSFGSDFSNVRCEDEFFSLPVQTSDGERSMSIPFLAVIRMADHSISVDFEFPFVEAEEIETEQNFLDTAVGCIGDDETATSLDLATCEQRACRAILISLMNQVEYGLFPTNAQMRLELDLEWLVSRRPDRCKKVNESISQLTIQHPLPRIVASAEPLGWRFLSDLPDNETFVPLRAISRLIVITDDDQVMLRFDRPAVNGNLDMISAPWLFEELNPRIRS